MVAPVGLLDEQTQFDCTHRGMAKIRDVLGLAGVLVVLEGHDADPLVYLRSRVARDAILANKFQSNDGWIVTPGECLIAATSIMRMYWDIAEEDRSFLAEFARFAARSVKHGGYEVG